MRNCSFFILFLSVSTFSIAQSIDTEMALFQKYQRYKERFYSNFIRIDWGGDGIGTYRTAVGELKAGHYEKAGYSIPASGHHPTKNRYFWPTNPNKPVNESLCNLNPELSDENGLLTWSEDTGVYLGLYLAMLSMEYRILKYDGNETRKCDSYTCGNPITSTHYISFGYFRFHS
jgi:hypothetical protein